MTNEERLFCERGAMREDPSELRRVVRECVESKRRTLDTVKNAASGATPLPRPVTEQDMDDDQEDSVELDYDEAQVKPSNPPPMDNDPQDLQSAIDRFRVNGAARLASVMSALALLGGRVGS